MKKNTWIRLLGQKILVFIVSMFLLSTLVFYVARLTPGDPLMAYYGDRVERMSTEERLRVEERLGLHEPITTQYAKWLMQAADGDFGISYKYKMPVQEVIESRAGNTLILGGIGFLLIFGGAMLSALLLIAGLILKQDVLPLLVTFSLVAVAFLLWRLTGWSPKP